MKNRFWKHLTAVTLAAMMLLAMLARGHVLLEDMPGVGKTTLALCGSGDG